MCSCWRFFFFLCSVVVPFSSLTHTHNVQNQFPLTSPIFIFIELRLIRSVCCVFVTDWSSFKTGFFVAWITNHPFWFSILYAMAYKWLGYMNEKNPNNCLFQYWLKPSLYKPNTLMHGYSYRLSPKKKNNNNSHSYSHTHTTFYCSIHVGILCIGTCTILPEVIKIYRIFFCCVRVLAFSCLCLHCKFNKIEKLVSQFDKLHDKMSLLLTKI